MNVFPQRWLAALAGVCLALTPHAAEVAVFAAASLTDALKQISTQYQAEAGDRIVLNLGASSALARQIQEGAPADLFFSADEEKMDLLEKGGLLARGTRRVLLSNSLVAVVPADSAAPIQSPRDLAGLKRLALAETRTVPAGIYARKFLESEGLWEAVKGRVVPVENVRAALAAVEAGNADAAIVYKTDALISKRVKTAFEIPPQPAFYISYPAAVLKEARQPEAARRFLAQLGSEKARDIFRAHGFALPGP